MSELRLIVFDCDGTLVDSQHQITLAMAQSFGAHGRPAPTIDQVRRVIGLRLEDAMAVLAPDGDDPHHHDLAATYRDSFARLRQAGEVEDALFPLAKEVLLELAAAGFLLGIATGKNMRGLRFVLEKHDLSDLFVTLQTPDNAPGKPHPGMMEQAMAETGVDQANTVLVGDTTFDIEMARNAGTHAVGVSWGYHAPEELHAAGAHHVIDEFGALVPWLEGLWARA